MCKIVFTKQGRICPSCLGRKYKLYYRHGNEKAYRRACPTCRGTGVISNV
jgi:hypothetical protein